MDTTAQEPQPLRIAVAASPFLLADSLRAVLERPGLKVTLLTDPSQDRFDVAVVDPDRPPLDADHVITLGVGERGRARGTVTNLNGDVVMHLEDLASIIRFVHSLVDRSAHRHSEA